MTDPKLNRRSLLGLAAAGGAAMGLGRAPAAGAAPTAASSHRVPFHGAHQAGIGTPVQRNMHCAAFAVVTQSRDELRELLAGWSDAAARMTAGRFAQPLGDPAKIQGDSGEAAGTHAHRLTLTFGFGETLFELDSVDRFGIRGRRPAALAPIPRFGNDELVPARSGGDLFVQACSDDATISFHALRNLIRIAAGAAAPQWEQVGFGPSSSTGAGPTPRNLQGFRDGTNNIRGADRAAMDRHVWVSGGRTWMRGGTYLVMRKIRMLLELWDDASLEEQERSIGRHKLSGAPLGSTHEHDRVRLDARDGAGELLIPERSHIREAAPAANDGTRLLRRGYSYVDGTDPQTGQFDAGLVFLAYQRDPRRAFVPMQRRMAKHDGLSPYIRHVASGVYAIPPGARRGGYVGETLFGPAKRRRVISPDGDPMASGSRDEWPAR